MSKLIFILIFTICWSAFGEKSKRQIFIESCEGSYFVANVNFSKSPQDRILKYGKVLCNAAAKRWDKESAWNSVKEPMLSGCNNAMEMVYELSLEKNVRDKNIHFLQKEVCKNLEGR